MEIRKSVLQDLPRIMEIYAHARSFMAQHGNPKQWGATNWPPEALIRQDIADSNSYVCVNDAGKVTGTFFYTYGPDIEPTYRDITARAEGLRYVLVSIHTDRRSSPQTGISRTANGWMTARTALCTGSRPTVPKKGPACSA